MTRCGALKRVDGRPPLVCTLPADHAGAHGVSQAVGLAPYVRWLR